MKLAIGVVLGTRPELIKCAPVILEAQKRGVAVGIIHTGQHYTRELDGLFFDDLNLPEPVAHVHVGSHPAPVQVGLMMQRLADVLESFSPSVVMVQGDTNSVLGGALCAMKMNIPVAHLEAGLRSDDWSMPEEANRVLTDRISKWLFCPTDLQRKRLAQEGMTHDGVSVVGNSIVDATMRYSKIAYTKSDIAERLGLIGSRYALLTMHRPGNVDDPERLKSMLEMIDRAASARRIKIVFPIHPRTNQTMRVHGITLGPSFIKTDPLGYFDLLRVQSSAELVLTDSGGIQEEACIMHVPCITLRPNTERPETVTVGANVLHHEIDDSAFGALMDSQMGISRTWSNPCGDGKTAERVMDILEPHL